MTKKEARIKALNIRKNNDQIISSKIVINRIIEEGIINDYQHIGIYYPIKNEIDVTELKNIYKNKFFYLPKTTDIIEFSLYNDNLIDGAFHTKEPVGEIVARDSIECFIIPCVAITNDNKRIGYGKGYYDRYLSNYKGKKIGICYKESSDVICDTDEYDIILDMKIVG